MLKICLVFWESEPQYAYKRYAYKKEKCIEIKGSASPILISADQIQKMD